MANKRRKPHTKVGIFWCVDRIINGCVYGDILPEMGNLVAFKLESGAAYTGKY